MPVYVLGPDLPGEMVCGRWPRMYGFLGGGLVRCATAFVRTYVLEYHSIFQSQNVDGL